MKLFTMTKPRKAYPCIKQRRLIKLHKYGVHGKSWQVTEILRNLKLENCCNSAKKTMWPPWPETRRRGAAGVQQVVCLHKFAEFRIHATIRLKIGYQIDPWHFRADPVSGESVAGAGSLNSPPDFNKRSCFRKSRIKSTPLTFPS